MTDKFDSANPKSTAVKEGIGHTYSLVSITQGSRKGPGKADYRLFFLFCRPAIRSHTNVTLRIGERLHLSPQGIYSVRSFLNWGADMLVDGGKLGIFTPIIVFLARKLSSAREVKSASVDSRRRGTFLCPCPVMCFGFVSPIG